MKRFMWLLVLISALLVTFGASAATLNLPAGLITIEEEAFYGDASLDQVVLGSKTQVIKNLAFAESSVKKVTIPESVHFIADNAFEGVNGLTVDAAEGTYGYSWAVKNGYITIPEVKTGAATQVIMPEKLQAGMNLEVQVFGPANTVSHTVILINNDTKERESLWIREPNGTVTWEGYQLSNGTYTVKVYTISDEYNGASPVSKTVTVSGTRPAGPEEIEIPSKLGWENFKIQVSPYEELQSRQIVFDSDGNQLDEWTDRSRFDEYLWLWMGGENVKSGSVSLMSYKDGLWSDWTESKVIEMERNYIALKKLVIPDSFEAGKDFDVSFEFEDVVDDYYITLYNKERDSIQNYQGSNLSSDSVIIPGYKIDAGTYYLSIDVRIDDEYNCVLDKELIFTEGRKFANIQLNTNKSTAYTNEYIEISIFSNGIEGAYIKIVGDDTEYKGCNLQEDGSGNCTTRLNVLGSASSSKDVTLSACVFLGDCWSEWSEPVTVHVTRPEPLPTPQINVKDNYETGEDIVVSLSDIEDSDYYYIYLKEYFSNETVIYRYFHKDHPVYLMPEKFGDDVVFSGSLFGSGTYYIEVNAYSSIRQSSTAKKTIKVSGVRESAPVVTADTDEFRINQTTKFSIDTKDCDQVYIQYNGYGSSTSWSNTYTITPTGDTTTWEYTFSNNAEDASFTFAFSARKNGKWTSTKEIKKTVLGLPQLEPAVIYVDDTIKAGTEFTIVVDPVENATSYNYWFYKIYGDGFRYYIDGSSSSYPVDERRYQGYNLEQGEYLIEVYAYAENYATSESRKTFTIEGEKAPAPYVTVDKTDFYNNEKEPVFTITAKGAEAVRCSNGSVVLVNEDGIATCSPSMYIYDDTQITRSFRFCYVKDDVWSAWSEPVSITIIKAEAPEPLSKAVIHLPESIPAGQDFTFSFDTVENATSYEAYVSHYYADSTYYSNYSAEPGKEMTASGRRLAAGTYVAKVNAYADGRTSSTSTVVFKVTGERADPPDVSADKNEYAAGDKINFNIDTERAEELYIYYSYSYNENYSSSGSKTVTVEEDKTAWTYSIPDYYREATFTFNFYLKKDGKWSKPEAITISLSVSGD